MDKTLISNVSIIGAIIKQNNILKNIDYDKLKNTLAFNDNIEESDEAASIEDGILNRKPADNPLIDVRKKAIEKQKLTPIFSPGVFNTINTEHSKGYPPSATNFPPYPSESGAPSVLPSGTWRSQF